jgi:UDPglucose--hexose-1-phosphate uridylyltransferase
VPELRSDRLTDTWVIVAEERRGRPLEHRLRAERRADAGPCPFCPGQEAMTPPELLALRDRGAADGPGWRVRVVPNKWPALGPLGNPVPLGFALRSMAGVGAHEVVVDTPAHDARPRDVSAAQWGEVALALQERMRALRADPRVAYVLAFKNQGPASGASLAHPHTQLLAMPLVPDRVAREARALEEHARLSQRCLLEDVLQEELDAKARVIEATDDVVLVCPWAARFPYEMLLAPRAHAPRFEEAPPAMAQAFGALLGRALARLQGALEGSALESYHLAIHTAPARGQQERFHWHAEVMPSLSFHAGFEKGTGMFLNHLGPERSAERLRGVALP